MTDVTDLRLFMAVARLGSMSAASAKMGLTPATVSKRINLLEQDFQTRLFQRSTRQMSLTTAGQDLVDRVSKIVDLVDEAKDHLLQQNTSLSGELRITAPTLFAGQHIVPHLPDFMKQFPGISLDMEVFDNFADVIGDSYDIAIRIGDLKDTAMVARKLAPDRRVICATPEYLNRAGVPQSLEDLETHGCLSINTSPFWRLEGPDEPKAVSTSSKIKTNSSEVLREALLAGFGLALISTWNVGQELNDGRLKIVLPEYQGSSRVGIFALYPSREFRPLKVTMFADFLAERLGGVPYWERKLLQLDRVS